MSSTESLGASSPPDRRPPAGSVYRGPEYRSAVGDGLPDLDPLVHPDPSAPPPLYRFVLAIVRWLAHHLFRFRIEGLANLPEPPYIIASNHQAWYDTLFILSALPRQTMVYTMAKRETVFNARWKRWLVPRLGVFPISPQHGELDAQGVATVYQVLSLGGVILIFPEGRYSRGRQLRPLKKGVAHFALQAGVPICPMAVTGVDRLRLFGEVSVSIGPPIRPDPPMWWDVNRRVLRVVESVRRGIMRAFGRDHDQRAGRLRDRVQVRIQRLLGRRRPELPPPAGAPPPR